MKERNKYLLEASLNFIIFLSSLIGCIIIFGKQRFTMLMFYTVDSNILALIASLLIGIYALRAYKSGEEIPPQIKKFTLNPCHMIKRNTVIRNAVKLCIFRVEPAANGR